MSDSPVLSTNTPNADAPPSLPAPQPQRSKRRRVIGWLVFLVFMVQVAPALLLYGLRNKLIFHPRTGVDPQAAVGAFRGDVHGELVHVVRPDGRRLAAYDARPLTGAGADDPVVLFFHGNAGDLSGRAGLLASNVRRTGLRWLMIDYSGYGLNEGKPSEREIERDALAAFDHLVAQGVPPGRIVVYGQSLGGAASIYACTERPAAGLVVQSAFASVSHMAADLYGWLPLAPLISRGVFPNARRIATLDLPIVIAHGRRDRIIPFSQAEQLQAAAGGDTPLIPIGSAGHNDVFEAGGPELLADLAARFRTWTQR